MRSFEIISEAPIGDIHTHGDFTKAGSLRPDDLSLASPKRQDKIRRVLQQAPVLIDLHFVNQVRPVDMTWHLDPVHARDALGFLSPEDLRHHYAINITPRPHAVNVVMIQNEGDDRIPFTPWIIAHRIGHAFYYTHRLKTDALFQKFFSTLNSVQEEYKAKTSNYHNPSLAQLARTFGTTRSCREGLIKTGRIGEWLYDCFAQLCVTGTISFNPAPPTIVETRIFYLDDDEIPYINKRFNKLRDLLIAGFSAMLTDAIGQIVVH